MDQVYYNTLSCTQLNISLWVFNSELPIGG
nr:MAG TPA: hypothetical protein [Crassvirales sp.]